MKFELMNPDDFSTEILDPFIKLKLWDINSPLLHSIVKFALEKDLINPIFGLEPQNEKRTLRSKLRVIVFYFFNNQNPFDNNNRAFPEELSPETWALKTYAKLIWGRLDNDEKREVHTFELNDFKKIYRGDCFSSPYVSYIDQVEI